MSNVVVNPAKVSFLKGEIALLTDTIKLLLLDATFTPNIDTDQFVSAITGHEISTIGTGYTRQTLTTKTVTQDSTNDRGVFDADDVSIPSSTFSTRYGAIIKDTGSDASSRIIGYVDFGATKVFVNETAKITWDAVGILTEL